MGTTKQKITQEFKIKRLHMFYLILSVHITLYYSSKQINLTVCLNILGHRHVSVYNIGISNIMKNLFNVALNII